MAKKKMLKKTLKIATDQVMKRKYKNREAQRLEPQYEGNKMKDRSVQMWETWISPSEKLAIQNYRVVSRFIYLKISMLFYYGK